MNLRFWKKPAEINQATENALVTVEAKPSLPSAATSIDTWMLGNPKEAYDRGHQIMFQAHYDYDLGHERVYHFDCQLRVSVNSKFWSAQGSGQNCEAAFADARKRIGAMIAEYRNGNELDPLP